MLNALGNSLFKKCMIVYFYVLKTLTFRMENSLMFD